MSRSKVIPVKAYIDLFSSLPDNDCLYIELLRLKCVTLLALCAMLRPSDIALNVVYYDATANLTRQFYIKLSDIVFDSDSMTVTFHGIKNDSQRRGFIVTLPCATNGKLCPVECMKT